MTDDAASESSDCADFAILVYEFSGDDTKKIDQKFLRTLPWARSSRW